ncbi:MAG: uroporphyrinogen decarboxylase family protein [Phycisphaerales bacterium]|nr:MAG: uroporphyrinogen decarboxylase family protein [Phycisphaerales bacterium]
MTDEQWDRLVSVIDGQVLDPLPVGFIIDSPWLPGWAGISTMDYFTSDLKWLDANLKVVRSFPDIMFLPGFWAEHGMCTEPSAFGTKCRWAENELPFAEKIIARIEDIDSLEKPNPRTDGLLPFVVSRLRNNRERIEDSGHRIRFAVARGPLNVATFLMGTTEFLMAVRTHPAEIARLLTVVTDFLVDWLRFQRETFDSIDGLLILDDIVGFLGEEDFREAALPYLKRVFGSLEVAVRLFHNDSSGVVCAPFLGEIGVNLFNFSFEHSLVEMKELTNNTVTLLGNIPPRDVLADGTPDDVGESLDSALEQVVDRSHLVLSCGGGMPGGVPTENIEAFLNAVRARGSRSV